MPLATGQILYKRYRVVKLLGQGGFGAVYKAWDINLNRPCAVKENLDTSTEAQRQFLREATVLANLSHPNLPRVTDHFIIESQGQYLVMDFVDGEDLQSMVDRSGPLPPSKALEWIHQVMDAIIYLHGRNPPVLHRDIKPANIRVTPDGRAVLVDFGLVKLYDSHLRTTVGARAVTPGFSPPEQYGQGNTDARTDIYALGATLYILLTGIMPPESVQRIATDTLKPVHVVNPAVLPGVGIAIARSMAIVPGNRYQKMSDFKETLVAAAAGRQVAGMQFVQPSLATQPGMPATAAGVSMPRPLGIPPVSAPTLQPGARPVKKKASGALIAILVAGGVIALTLACIGLIAYGNSVYQQTATAAVYATNTAKVAAVRATGTAYGKQTATQNAKVNQTRTAYARLTSTAQAVINQTATAYAEENGVIIYGPNDGSLPHDPDDGNIAMDQSNVELADFIAEVTFENPYSTSMGEWDYGILFRHEGGNDQYRLMFTSYSEWRLAYHAGSSSGETVASGTLYNFDASQYGSNTIKLFVKGSWGQLYVNDEYIADLDLSDRTNTGDVAVGTGFYAGREFSGYSTDYSNFTIWSW